jgi:hypothetical protein
MPSRLRLAWLALLIAGPVAAQVRPATEEIGSWLLTCPAEAKGDPCQLRHRAWVLPPGTGGPGASLEVLNRGNQFVPIVALRGLSTQAALGGVLALKANVGLRFDNLQRIEFGCGLDGAAVVCVPEGPAAASAAGQLPAARSVLVQIQLSLPGVIALPQQDRMLDLQRTPDALARFHATAPASEAVAALPGLDWRGFLDRVLRDAGFEHGAADLLPSVGGWSSGQRR